MIISRIASRSIALSARLRFPLIKFRYGGARDNKTSSSGAAAAVAGHGGKPQSGEVVYDFQLAPRFKRKPLDQEEIDYINRGGPA